MLSVALVEPETPGNIGSVARVMKNFGFKRLLLVNPKCDYLDGEAYGRAMHAREILKSAAIVRDFSQLRKFDYVIGTTAVLGSDYNVVRSPITPGQLSQQLAQQLGSSAKKVSIAVVFGREGTGLTTNEIASCDIVVTIPASKKYGALNISHAVAIVLYELFQASKSVKSTSHISPATGQDKKTALSMVSQLLARMDFAIDSRRQAQSMVWSRLISKSFLTRREIFALIGFLQKMIKLAGKKQHAKQAKDSKHCI